ncbi:zinc finger protein 521-like [Mytilus trossulus]|uniref:zinc finger protein 521-like n=1 Tax=Mytilus trossulus TaxID=6551 RepID=UPI003007D446
MKMDDTKTYQEKEDEIQTPSLDICFDTSVLENGVFTNDNHVYTCTCSYCDICRNIFENKDDLYGHVLINHGNELKRLVLDSKMELALQYPCCHCGEMFATIAGKDWHIRWTHVPLVTCSYCNTKYTSECGLIKHIDKYHKDIPKRKNKADNNRMMSCHYCGIQFTSLLKVKNHIQETHTESLLQCYYCDKKVNNLGTLYVHIRIEHADHINDFKIIKLKIKEHMRMSSGGTSSNSHTNMSTSNYNYQDGSTIDGNNNTMAIPCQSCEFCERKFNTDDLLYSHIFSRHQDKVRRLFLESNEHLKIHYIAQQGLDKYIHHPNCIYLKLSIIDEPQWGTVDFDLPSCQYCGESFVSLSELQTHTCIRKKYIKTEYQESCSNETFPSTYGLESHGKVLGKDGCKNLNFPPKIEGGDGCHRMLVKEEPPECCLPYHIDNQ